MGIKKKISINDFCIKKHYELLHVASRIKELKNKDYNRISNRFDYNLHGNQTCIDEIYKKVLRLINLIDTEYKPNCEKITDTLIDIINYVTDFYAFLEWNNNKKDK